MIGRSPERPTHPIGDHLHGNDRNGRQEYCLEKLDRGDGQKLGANEGTGQNTERDRRHQRRIEVASLQIHANARGRRALAAGVRAEPQFLGHRVLQAAVTPIMKLLVAVVTLNGMPMI